jgi:hypothetical protein
VLEPGIVQPLPGRHSRSEQLIRVRHGDPLPSAPSVGSALPPQPGGAWTIQSPPVLIRLPIVAACGCRPEVGRPEERSMWPSALVAVH